MLRNIILGVVFCFHAVPANAGITPGILLTMLLADTAQASEQPAYPIPLP